jgi:hypothetical protein
MTVAKNLSSSGLEEWQPAKKGKNHVLDIRYCPECRQIAVIKIISVIF